jgi:hypothetical protein
MNSSISPHHNPQADKSRWLGGFASTVTWFILGPSWYFVIKPLSSLSVVVRTPCLFC